MFEFGSFLFSDGKKVEVAPPEPVRKIVHVDKQLMLRSGIGNFVYLSGNHVLLVLGVYHFAENSTLWILNGTSNSFDPYMYDVRDAYTKYNKFAAILRKHSTINSNLFLIQMTKQS